MKKITDRGTFPSGIHLIKRVPKKFGMRPGIYTSIELYKRDVATWSQQRLDLPWISYPEPKRVSLEALTEWLSTLTSERAAWEIRSANLNVSQKLLIGYYYANRRVKHEREYQQKIVG